MGSLNHEDRVSLILGRAIIRSEVLQVQLELALVRIAELESKQEETEKTD